MAGAGDQVNFSIEAETSRQAAETWHVDVTQGHRNHLVQKLVQEVFPTRDPNMLSDRRMNNLVQYARTVEARMFNTASSQEEYYRKLADKIMRIQRELEEKRIERMRRDRQAPQSVRSLPGHPVASRHAAHVSEE